MRVIIDERESAIFERCTFLTTNKLGPVSIKEVSKEVLCLGDIVFRADDNTDILIIERKSLRDLLASIKDSRYEEQSYRLLHASGLPPHKIIYIIEGVMNTLKNDTEKKIVYSAISSLNVFKGFSVMRTSSVVDTADLILAMADKIVRNAKKNLFPWEPIYTRQQPNSTPKPLNVITDGGGKEDGTVPDDDAVENTMVDAPEPANYCTVVKKVKKENITVGNFGEIMIMQIPGVSSVSAIAIMKRFKSPIHLIDSLRIDSDCLDTVYIETERKRRKLGKNIIFNIKKYFTEEAYEASPPETTV